MLVYLMDFEKVKMLVCSMVQKMELMMANC